MHPRLLTRLHRIRSNPTRRRPHADPLAVWLAARRRDRGLRQHHIAHACGVHPVSVSHWETGWKRPTLAHLAAWCDALDATLADIHHALGDPP